MDEAKAAAYYDRMKALGSGAASMKQGLGFNSPGARPQGIGRGGNGGGMGTPPQQAGHPFGGHGPRPLTPFPGAPGPADRPPVQHQPQHFPGGAPSSHGMMPPHGSGPPPFGRPPPGQGGPPMRPPPFSFPPGGGLPPYGMMGGPPSRMGPRMPPPGMMLRPGVPPPPGMGGFPGSPQPGPFWAGERPGMGPPGQPARPPGQLAAGPPGQEMQGAPRAMAAAPLPMSAAQGPPGMPLPSPAALAYQAQQSAAAAQQAQQAAVAADIARQAAEARALSQREAGAWIAHKTESGQVYYFNTQTNESSWERPPGFQGDGARASAQPKPVSTVPVKGTHWVEVSCDDGKKYYFNATTQETSWTIPPEVVAARKDQALPSTPGISPAAAAHLAKTNGTLLINDGGDGDGDNVSFSEEDIRPPLPAEAPGEGAIVELEQAPPLPQRSQEELAADFRDLLSEKGVTPFSRWERELPKLIDDPRWTAVGSLKERRALFDDYCRTSADEHVRRKAQRARAGREGFQALLEEAASPGALAPDAEEGEAASAPGINADTTLESLEPLWGADPRWQACDAKVREELLQACITPLRRAEEATAQKATVSQAAQEAAYRELLRERRVGPGARWSKFKEAAANDERYRALPRESREALFRAYVAEAEAAVEAEKKQQKEREEKEREARRKAARDAEESERRRRKAAAAGAAKNYQTLLAEAVKDPAASWHDWRSRLSRDPQKRATNPALEPAAAESLFREHVLDLQKRATDAYLELLEEVIWPLLPRQRPSGGRADDGPAALRSFPEAEKLLSEDGRFQRAPVRDREKLWRRFVDDMILERDDPAAAARRGRLIGTRHTAGARKLLNDGEGAVTDKAYEREYLAPDRKRIKRD